MHTKTKTNKEPPQTMGVHKTINQQQQNHCLRTNSSLSHQGRGLKCILLASNLLTLDSVVVNTQKPFSSHEGFLTNAMHHHRETI